MKVFVSIYKLLGDRYYLLKNLFEADLKIFSFIPNFFSLLLFGRSLTRISLKNNVRFSSPPNHPLTELVTEIYQRKVYTPANLGIESDDIVLDVGANIGVFTAFAAQLTKNQVFSFEPSPENVSFIKKNLLRNNIRNVIISEKAVFDKVGQQNLMIENNPAGHILVQQSKAIDTGYLQVPTTTIPEIMNEYNLSKIDFLKLDCEGSEGKILSSLPLSFLSKIRKVAMEFHDNVSVLKHDDIIGIFKKAGFNTNLVWDGFSDFGYIYAVKQ